MSMISSLIDKLRKSADEWNQSNMFELARMCSDAADTIWQLRDDLQRANAENTKLRDELDQWHRLTAGIELPEYPITEFNPKDLERDNAKLRELVQDMWFWHYEGHIDSESQERQMLHIDAVIQRMRELGVEP